MHCYERPTVTIGLDVATLCPDETRPTQWEWTPCRQVQPVQEYVYTPEELCRVMRHYGELVSMELRPTSYPRFRLIARGNFTGRPLATGEWVWNANCGKYEPHGELWLTIPPVHEWPEEVLRAQSARSGQKIEPCKGCVAT